jgi:hypothetical protein
VRRREPSADVRALTKAPNPDPVPRYNPPFGLWPLWAAHVQEDC